MRRLKTDNFPRNFVSAEKQSYLQHWGAPQIRTIFRRGSKHAEVGSSGGLSLRLHWPGLGRKSGNSSPAHEATS